MRIEDLFSSNIAELTGQGRKKENSFKEDLKKLILSVDSEIKKSQKLKEAFLKGEDVPIYQLTIQAQKAKVSLELLTKLRDEALKAYNQIMNIRV
jgi:flagellar hook-basal body complex protein FliE